MGKILGEGLSLLGGKSLFSTGTVGGGIRDFDEAFVPAFEAQKTKGKGGGGGQPGGGGGGDTKPPKEDKPPKGGGRNK